jgi:hypothetical protein
MKTLIKTSMALAWCICLPLLNGCESTDPLLVTDGNWNPVGVNAANLAAEVANPTDLIVGHSGDAGTDGHLAAAAIDRLRKDRVKKLQDTGLSSVQVSGSSGSDAAAAAAATGAPQ